MLQICESCSKPSELCICQLIQPMKNQTHVLILQHPQEPDKDLGTARITQLALKDSTLSIGLSWPNLKTALKKQEVNPSRWAVLYLGSGIKGLQTDRPLQFVTHKGTPKPRPQSLDGIVVLDGTWSQAKALWWRNPWLLKLHRAILTPEQPSLYKNLRKEPRKECLSTLETVAEVLVALGEPQAIQEELKGYFSQLLSRQRERIRKKKA